MSVMSVRDHLLHELEHGIRTTQKLLSVVKPEDWSYRPKDNMRTLLEVTRHLVMVPATDLVILQEKQGPELDSIEDDIRHVTDPKALGELMQQSYESFKSYMVSLSEDELLHKSTKPFYADQGSVQVKWLIEVVTHVFHHRAQLFNYLKQLGYDVNMFYLY